jgi:hypothetical protein
MKQFDTYEEVIDYIMDNFVDIVEISEEKDGDMDYTLARFEVSGWTVGGVCTPQQYFNVECEDEEYVYDAVAYEVARILSRFIVVKTIEYGLVVYQFDDEAFI